MVLTALGLRYYAQDAPLAIIEVILLAFHESSHWALVWAPRTAYVLAGSVGQIAIPLAIGLYLWRRQGDPLGGAVGLGWAGLSCWGAQRYIADAPHEDLPLVGGTIHDWAYLLGPEGFDRMDMAADLAYGVRLAGIAAVTAAVMVCLIVPILTARGILRAPGPPAPVPPPAWLGPLPVAAPERDPLPELALPDVYPHPRGRAPIAHLGSGHPPPGP